MARPLLDVHCVNRPGCDYPVSLRVAMDDGTVQTYTLEARINFRVMTFGEIVTGYPKHPRRRNRLHRCER
jgi:hypothetical protein